ncbi:MAG: hypothetical protein ACRDJE_20825 [Dehalococcoidia bacterium]
MRKLLNSTRTRVAGAMAAAAVLAAFVLAVNPTAKDVLGQTVPIVEPPPVVVVPPPAAPAPAPAAATTQNLVVGCNNVVAPASETIQQVAGRVSPPGAVVGIWRQVPGTTTFQGAAVGTNVPAGVSNLTSVDALSAIFICVDAAATYRVS